RLRDHTPPDNVVGLTLSNPGASMAMSTSEQPQPDHDAKHQPGGDVLHKHALDALQARLANSARGSAPITDRCGGQAGLWGSDACESSGPIQVGKRRFAGADSLACALLHVALYGDAAVLHTAPTMRTPS